MVRDAEKYAEEDKKVTERLNARNELESLIYSLKNAVNDGKIKMNGMDKKALGEAVEEAIEWLDDNPEAEKSEIKKKKREVEEVSNPIMAKLYGKSGGREEESEGGNESDNGGEEEVDFDFDEL